MTALFFRPKALAGIRSASPENQKRIRTAINDLRQGTFPLHTKKLGGVADGYRTRVGQWRILFTLQKGIADIADIFIKKERGDYRRRGK